MSYTRKQFIGFYWVSLLPGGTVPFKRYSSKKVEIVKFHQALLAWYKSENTLFLGLHWRYPSQIFLHYNLLHILSWLSYIITP